MKKIPRTPVPVEDEPSTANPAFVAIWSVIGSLPRGRATSYGAVARRAGLPRRARLVAQALRAAPDAMNLPWHRVVRADGRIAFPAGSDAFELQKRLLEAEGVGVTASGRVCQAQDEEDLDAGLWRM